MFKFYFLIYFIVMYIYSISITMQYKCIVTVIFRLLWNLLWGICSYAGHPHVGAAIAFSLRTERALKSPKNICFEWFIPLSNSIPDYTYWWNVPRIETVQIAKGGCSESVYVSQKNTATSWTDFLIQMLPLWQTQVLAKSVKD